MAFRIVLVEPEGEENVGYVARIMKNFGFENLVVVNPKTRIGSVARQRAMHGRDILGKIRRYRTLDDVCRRSDLVVGTTGKGGSGYNVLRTALTPREFAKEAKKLKGSVSVLFGCESVGLKNSELEKCDIVLTIPADEKYTTLSISHAVAIVLYELFVSTVKTARDQPSRDEKIILKRLFSRMVRTLGYTRSKERIVRRTFDNLVGRSMISRREFFTLAGLFNRLKTKSLKNK